MYERSVNINECILLRGTVIKQSGCISNSTNPNFTSQPQTC
jgi:hypothetical protein